MHSTTEDRIARASSTPCEIIAAPITALYLQVVLAFERSYDIVGHTPDLESVVFLRCNKVTGSVVVNVAKLMSDLVP
jgi:hypothetical protein